MDDKELPPRVLVIGLDPYRVPGPWDPEPVAERIERATARFAEEGIDVQNCLIGLDGSDDIESVVSGALSERPWDCVLIGGGIRNSDEQFELFETIVNLVHRHAAGSAIAFNQTLDDVVPAALRGLRREPTRRGQLRSESLSQNLAAGPPG
jgi:hypothetical protein